MAADTRAGAENPVTVLIVDDNLAYAQNIAEILEKAMTRSRDREVSQIARIQAYATDASSSEIGARG
jgi:hypothetical protein